MVALIAFMLYRLVGNPSSVFDHYVRLADAFQHGRLYLDNAPSHLELARYDANGVPCGPDQVGCRGYVIDPPAPTLLILPFLLLFGGPINAALVSAFWGAVAMGLFWVAAARLGWGLRTRVAMTVLLAFGTDFWWAAADGSLWTFAETSAVLFSMAALAVAAGRGRPWVVGLLLGLAGLSRLPCFLGFPFFLVVLLGPALEGITPREAVRSRVVQRTVLSFGSGLGAMAAVSLSYNWLRFGTVTDKGFDHPGYADEPWFAEGRFDLSHIPRHVDAIFFAGPKITEGHFPYFAPSIYGMALFLVTPAFLFAFNAKRGRLEIAAAVSLVLVAIPHVLHGVTGWTQFGYRYSLDYLPMLAVLAASGMRHQVGRRAALIIAVSVFMAAWGPLFFFETPVEDLLHHQWRLPAT